MRSQANGSGRAQWTFRLGFSLLLLGCPALAVLGGVRADAPGSWQDTVQQRIADSEYQVTWQERTVLPDLEASWQAPNRAHGLRTYFTDSGIRVVPRTEDLPAWEWSLMVAGWGRVGSEESDTFETARPRVEGSKVAYDRGEIAEWYLNDQRGLEQGFTLASRPRESEEVAEKPANISSRSLIRIDLALGGTLNPVVSEDGQAIDFVTPAGAKVLH